MKRALLERAARRLAVAALVVGSGCGSTPAGSSLDASDDAGGADAGGADLIASADLGPAACSAAFAGCTDFTDGTASPAARLVGFASFAYSPRCLRIKVGQAVAFHGDFAVHPLRQACGPRLLASTDSGQDASFTATAAGTVGYYCLDHGNPQGQAMSGAIDVVP